MKVILTQDVKAQGKKGELIDVSEGYARNFLIPKKLAVEANAKNMTEYKNAEKSKQIHEEKELALAKETAEKLLGVVVKIQRTCGADEKLYGSVGTKDIADALLEQHKIEIDKRKLVLQDNIKSFGTYEVEVKVYPEISAKLKVTVSEGK